MFWVYLLAWPNGPGTHILPNNRSIVLEYQWRMAKFYNRGLLTKYPEVVAVSELLYKLPNNISLIVSSKDDLDLNLERSECESRSVT